MNIFIGYVSLYSSIYIVSYFVNSEIRKRLNKAVSFLFKFKFCTQITSSMTYTFEQFHNTINWKIIVIGNEILWLRLGWILVQETYSQTLQQTRFTHKVTHRGLSYYQAVEDTRHMWNAIYIYMMSLIWIARLYSLENQLTRFTLFVSQLLGRFENRSIG